MSKAKIFLNGKQITETDSNGFYQLQRLKAGTYNLNVFAGTILFIRFIINSNNCFSDNFLFKEVSVKLNPNSKIPDLLPTSYKVCGTVISDKSQSVTFSQVGGTTVITTLSDSNSGQFCEYINPGKYQVQVVVDNADSEKGMQYVI